MASKKYVSIPELAKILGLSRATIYNRVKKGEIPAEKVGNTYVITDETVTAVLGGVVTDEDKEKIDAAVRKTVEEYGDVLKELGRE